uniref:Adaptor protein ClpS core domain-containing protein n=1 Tax=Corethron hystrix TaxID=216773 RepID=A0A7S1BGE2_9STRA|mmetsp:Transcript_25555/g.58958  ORF Transcript_25555/g.58958 Transcript_25555/m.58958 type:complete len:168 (+) Transcript_25555:376-879(+)|eukprot:CAMPEP_0113307868 /NCGR_PEP_ID=MMETSP0010_2-20120614/6540_1 /TAXON_ID=216773 ORGANISM="Corethron hystrix, Strain 308" /NCGR_SAMPLE_ID=MMETSP0010_2 /ASSEMBLY_ACC=CAM_ASM_000155 /LENGTH=167 /DNA_ID=CAMNT_0000162807 /DNA_START=310 /DNA_END=813 /DNA_ORIENTATION=+ /assembly_acc=CAM_ASM_000155
MYRSIWFSLLVSSAAAFGFTSRLSTVRNIYTDVPFTALESSSRIFGLQSKHTSLSMVTISAPGGATVLEKPDILKSPEKSGQDEMANSKGWELRIYNDHMNTREHVARCLVQVTGLNEGAAYQVMMQAHKFGVGAVGVFPYEKAETYYEQLVSNGIMSDMVPLDDDE